MGKESARHRPSDPDLRAGGVDHLLPPLGSYSPASSSSSHASRRATPPLLSYRLRTGSDPVLNGGSERPAPAEVAAAVRPDPTSRLEGAKGSSGTEEGGKVVTKGISSKLSPRLGKLMIIVNCLFFKCIRI